MSAVRQVFEVSRQRRRGAAAAAAAAGTYIHTCRRTENAVAVTRGNRGNQHRTSATLFVTSAARNSLACMLCVRCDIIIASMLNYHDCRIQYRISICRLQVEVGRCSFVQHETRCV